MFGITLKRSAATLGVVTGLLVAAGPANATPAGISGKEMSDAIVSADAFGLSFEHLDVKAPTKADDRMKVSGHTTVVVLIGANDYGFADTSSSGGRR